MTDPHTLERDEQLAIRTLKRLAKRWPKSLWLFSASGSLCVMRNGEDGERVRTVDGAIDANSVIAFIDIPNDGGDW